MKKVQLGHKLFIMQSGIRPKLCMPDNEYRLRHSDLKSRSSLDLLENGEVKTWFEVSMEESSVVYACKTLKHLEAPVSHFYFREKFHSVLHKLV